MAQCGGCPKRVHTNKATPGIVPPSTRQPSDGVVADQIPVEERTNRKCCAKPYDDGRLATPRCTAKPNIIARRHSCERAPNHARRKGWFSPRGCNVLFAWDGADSREAVARGVVEFDRKEFGVQIPKPPVITVFPRLIRSRSRRSEQYSWKRSRPRGKCLNILHHIFS